MSITPIELVGMIKRESWPMHWLLDSLGQKIDDRFPMVGNTMLWETTRYSAER